MLVIPENKLTVSDIKYFHGPKPSPKTIKICNDHKIPLAPKQTGMSFVVMSNNTFVNSIRRGTSVKYNILSCDPSTIQTDDTYIIPYQIQSIIEQIPIKQDFKSSNITLNKHNTTDNVIPVTTDDIYIDGKQSDIFTHIKLFDLIPKTFININLIIKSGNRGKSRIYSPEGNISVHDLDLEAFEKKNEKKYSDEHESINFKIVVPLQCDNVIHPVDIIMKICDHYLDYVEKLLVIDNRYVKITNYTDHSKIVYEDIDMGLLVEHYIYDADRTIKNVNSKRIDTLLEVYIYHHDIINIVNIALNNIKRDFTILKKSFNKKNNNL